MQEVSLRCGSPSSCYHHHLCVGSPRLDVNHGDGAVVPYDDTEAGVSWLICQCLLAGMCGVLTLYLRLFLTTTHSAFQESRFSCRESEGSDCVVAICALPDHREEGVSLQVDQGSEGRAVDYVA